MTRDSFVRMQTNRFTAAVRKLLSIKGEEHDVNFGVHLEDERPEYSFLKGEYLYSQWHEAASDAAHVVRLGVNNPANSNQLLVVQSVFAECDVANTLVQLGQQRGGFTGSYAGNLRTRDPRIGGGTGAGTTMQYGSSTIDTTAGFTMIYTQLTVLGAGQVLDFTAAGGRVGPIIVPPGWGCYIASTAVAAITLRGTFMGYVRSLESGELI